MLPMIQLSPRSRCAVSAEGRHAHDHGRHREAVTRYDMDGRGDFADADAGLIAPWPDQVVGADGHVIFDPAWFDIVSDDIPALDTVNPNLWRPAQLMRRGGLYKVTDGAATPEYHRTVSQAVDAARAGEA